MAAGKFKSMVSVLDKDMGWNKITKEIKHFDNAFVKVGLQGDDIYPETGESVVDVAYFNEFGTSSIPERPFMRQTYDKNLDKLNELTKKLVGDVEDTRVTTEAALGQLGAWYVAKIQDEIVNGNWMPNSPATIAAKERKRQSGNNMEPRPLIDTGRMRQSVTYEVIKK